MEIESDNLNKAHIVRDFVLCVKKNPLFTKLTAYVLAYFGGDSFPQNLPFSHPLNFVIDVIFYQDFETCFVFHVAGCVSWLKKLFNMSIKLMFTLMA